MGDTASGAGADAALDSPELLRWRADILLDEMMLGAVDVAAGRPDTTGAISSDAISSNTVSSNTVSSDSFGANTVAVSESPPESWSSRTTSVAGGQSDAAGPSGIASNIGDTMAGPGNAVQTSAASASAASSVTAQIADEERFLRPPTASLVAAGEVASPVDGRVESAANAWQRDLSASSAFDDHDRRSNLLPRETQVDVSSRLREIDQLEADLDRALPSEHEWSVRSHHLLAKAANILQHSPERSAEVDYYLQQVRAILERAQQSLTDSRLYVKRLNLYLTAWALFAAVGLVASIIYAEEIRLSVAAWFDLASDGVLATHLPTLMATLSAATLGASIGSMRLMGRYRKQGRGYIDRKYSLRCLLLPFLSILFALVIYLLFGLAAFFLGVDPVQAPLIVLIPASLAFLFGLVQEYFYGTAA